MAALVLDASVAFSWCFPGDPTEDTPYSRRVLSELAVRDALVPEIWAFEIANSIFVSCNKRKRISAAQVEEYLDRLMALPIQVEPRGCGPTSGWRHGLGGGISRPTMPPMLILRCATTFL
jgi:hypothetical protein